MHGMAFRKSTVIPAVKRHRCQSTSISSQARLSGLSWVNFGLRKFLEGLGHTFVVTSDKEGPTSVFERELPDAEVVISKPFWPAYLTAERIAKAKKLKLAITAGIGSDGSRRSSSRHQARRHGS